ncbi:hypothetical protein ACU4GD_45775 [Cupriavidus basilensis]
MKMKRAGRDLTERSPRRLPWRRRSRYRPAARCPVSQQHRRAWSPCCEALSASPGADRRPGRRRPASPLRQEGGSAGQGHGDDRRPPTRSVQRSTCGFPV